MSTPATTFAARRNSHRAAFTLFEVAISLGILTVVILSVALAYPIGIKTQQLSRFQLYACTKMLELSDWWVQRDNSNWDQQVESEQLAQNCFISWPNDLDTSVDRQNSTILPLPSAIARRFDSENNEIARILDSGGRLYYVMPRPFEGGAEEIGFGRIFSWEPLPPAAQSLVFGIVGYPQQNSLPNHPCLAMPYYEWYPCPPQPWERDNWQIHFTAGEFMWKESWTEFDELYAVFSVENYDANHTNFAAMDVAIAKAEALAIKVGVSMEVLAGSNPVRKVPKRPAALASFPTPWGPGNQDVFPPAYRILALRYLAMAAQARTSDEIVGDPVAADAAKYEQLEKYSKAVHEACMEWAMRYAATDPYEWGAPRPLNRAVCFDFPLLQFDLFSPAITTSDGENDKSWPVIGRIDGHGFGRARGQYGWNGQVPDNRSFIAGSWGNRTHFNLTEPFDAAERCRQVVCWSVDWQSYEDFESCPSEPLDSNHHFKNSRGVQVSSERVYAPDEAEYLWAVEDHSYRILDKANGEGEANIFHGGAYIDHTREGVVESETFRSQWMGLYGADRNGDTDFDEGSLPPSVRLRAATVARFNFYDRRIIFGARN
jgi:hypothetical protein